MSKHFGKIVLFAAAAGAIAAGVYYYLTQKDTEFDDDFDDFEDFDDFDDDDESKSLKNRHYVSLDSGSEEDLDEEDSVSEEDLDEESDSSEGDLDEEDASSEGTGEPVPDKTEEFFDDEDDDVNELKKLDGAI